MSCYPGGQLVFSAIGSEGCSHTTTILYIHFIAAPLLTCFGVTRKTFHPITVAELYFVQSSSKPAPLVCLPFTQLPPSTSIAIMLLGQAKSKAQSFSSASANRFRTPLPIPPVAMAANRY